MAELERAVAVDLLERSPGARSGGEFTVVARDEHDGRPVGGIDAVLTGGTCELQHLYVEAVARGRGIGRALLRAAEQEAARRGCHQVVLFTHASQGGRLYPELGYDLVGRVDGYPVGDAALWFRKPLT